MNKPSSEKPAIVTLKSQRRLLYSTFMQAPVGIGIFMGPSYVVDLINPPLCNLFGKTTEEMMGKPVFEVLTHTRGQGFEELLNRVLTTGETFNGKGMKASLVRDGRLQDVYINFVYEPFREDDGTISGVIAVATEVTEIVIGGELLKEAEERARLATDAVGLGTYDLDLLTGEMITSKQFAKIFGFDDVVSRKKYVSVFHPDDLELRKEAHRTALETGVLFYEARVIKKDKSVHWLRVEGKVFYDEKKKPYRILGILLDITRERRDNEQMRKLITLVDNSVDLMSILELDGTNSYLNESGRIMLGFDNEEEVKATPISALHDPADFKQVEAEVLPGVMKDGRWSGRMLVRHLKTGEIFPVSNNCIRIDDPVSGLPIAVGAVMHDLRPELAMVKELKESEEHLRLATTAAQLGTFDMDIKAGTMEWDARCRELFGIFSDQKVTYTEDFLLGLHPDDRDRVSKVIDIVLDKSKSDGSYDVEYRTIGLEDKKLRWVRAKGQALFNEHDDPVRFIGTVLDITDKKLEEIRKNDFIAMVSHELKTPLTSIKSYIQIVKNKAKEQGDNMISGMLSRAEAQTNKMVGMIEGFLNISRLENGRMNLNKELFEVDELIFDTVSEVIALSNTHPVNLAPPSGLKLVADREKIGQVLLNLLNNSIKYSVPGSAIETGCKSGEGKIIIWVKDHGIGIKEEDRSRLFERFYRANESIQTASGFGIGLYLSSEIVALHQGEIAVESTYGKGSVFYVSLPVE